MGILLDLALHASRSADRARDSAPARTTPCPTASAASAATPPPVNPRAEARRQRVLAMLAARQRAILTDPDDPAYPDAVVIALAIRTPSGPVYGELLIERSRYDGLLLLELFERHSQQVH